MQNYFNTQSPNDATHNNIGTDIDIQTYNLIGLGILSFPILLLLGLFTYKKYRRAVLRRQIITLEKMWLLDLKDSTYRKD